MLDILMGSMRGQLSCVLEVLAQTAYQLLSSHKYMLEGVCTKKYSHDRKIWLVETGISFHNL